MKRSLAAAALAIPIAGGLLYGQHQRTEEASLPATQCMKDLSCWSDRNDPDAQRECRHATEVLQPSVKWIGEFYDPLYARTKWADPTRGTLLLAGSMTQVDGINVEFSCQYDPANKSAKVTRTG